MSNKIDYENRVVFFLDILGFRELIYSNLKEKGADCSSIFEVFEFIDKFYQDEIDEKYSATKKITFFSDSIIISFVENEPDQVFKTISDIQILLVILVIKGIVMRGAISYGKLFHNDKYLFGPAFVEVYLTEREKAKFPRIICDDSIILLSQQGKSVDSAKQDLETFFEIVKTDNDEFLYIDYFEGIESLFNDNYEYINYLLNLRKLIIDNINNASCVKVRDKYLWMRNKYNDTVKVIISNNESSKISDCETKQYVEQLTLIDEK